ncbi:hypothetical protein QN357_13500 [Cryobacterium sp. RTC2.1]|uniref:hypothetical protein n=1 Tax=Cryobacterium sp. RTC2.1 TaxID=3048634 RepID=UPI002B22B6FE|nr:hypothetical protein [Cryobacterium sp. RTC2.1]MEB0003943.1 hypothetical protein [Cryobacterium sp. RTC2.1]
MQVESLWPEIEEAWGLLRASDVAKVLRVPEADDAEVSRMRIQGKLLAFEREGEQVYPGFQFDFESGVIQPVIQDLVQLANKLNWAHDDFVIWLCSPSGYFGGDRPVDHLHEPDDLLKKARSEATVDW